MNIKKNTILEYGILSVIACLFLLFFSSTTSPVFNNNFGIVDSSVFMLIGKGMANGLVPYVDLFDHKGPVLFFLEALGWLIAPNGLGNFFIQWIWMTVNLILILKIAALFINKKWLWFPISIFLLILGATLEGGNLTEEYCLPFLFLPMYLALRYFKTAAIKTKEHPPVYAFIYGICFTLIVFIRMNNGVLICAIVLVIMVHLLANRAYLNFFHNALAFMGGSLGVFLPIALYFLINKGFGDMIYGTFLFNMKYAEGLSAIATTGDLIKFCQYAPPLIFSMGMGVLYLLEKENRYIGSLLLIGSLVTFFSLLLGGVFYHYFILTTPCLVLGVVLGMDLIQKKGKAFFKKEHLIVTYLVLIIFMGAMGLYLSFFIDETKNIKSLIINEPQKEYYDMAVGTASSIPPDEVDSVFGYSVPAGWFLMTDIMPSYKYYTLQEWWGLYDPKIISDVNEMLENEPPKWIVMNNEKQTNEKIYQVLETKYEYVTKDKEVSLYRRITE